MSSYTQRLLLWLVPPVAYGYLRLLRRTMKIAYRNEQVLQEARRDPGHYILAFWHSRSLMMPYAYPGGRMTVMSGWHADAELAVRILRRFGLEFVRGSSTRGGTGALRDLARRLSSGSDAGVTPDGPRGPRRRVKSGVIAVARMSGLPIIPVAFSAAPARRLGSWDRTLIPRPFSRGLFIYGEPVRVRRAADRAEQESLRRALEEQLDRLTDLADRETEMGPEDPRPSQEAP